MVSRTTKAWCVDAWRVRTRRFNTRGRSQWTGLYHSIVTNDWNNLCVFLPPGHWLTSHLDNCTYTNYPSHENSSFCTRGNSKRTEEDAKSWPKRKDIKIYWASETRSWFDYVRSDIGQFVCSNVQHSSNYKYQLEFFTPVSRWPQLISKWRLQKRLGLLFRISQANTFRISTPCKRERNLIKVSSWVFTGNLKIGGQKSALA